MKKTYQKIRIADKQIKACRKEIETLQILPFYSLFNRERQRATDLDLLNKRLETLLKHKQQMLKTLQKQVILQLEQVIIKS